MPGSLDLGSRMHDPRWDKDREGGDQDEEDGEEDEEDGDEGEEPSEAADADFDDDLLAASEMKNVPFL